MTSSANNYL